MIKNKNNFASAEKSMKSLFSLKLMDIIQLIILAITCIGALFANYTYFIDSKFMSKWIITIMGGLLLIGNYTIICIFLTMRPKPYQEMIQTLIIRVIILSTFSQAICGILQYVNIISPTSSFIVTGSFDNPAGFAASLCIGSIFCLIEIKRNTDINRWIFVTIYILIVVAVILSKSRTGILSVIVVLGYCSLSYIQLLTKMKKRLLLVLIIGIIAGLYYTKKDSVYGRLLIWECSIQMIKENLLTGGGTGTFETHYMDYQAEYFKKHPNSPYSLLADNVQYPFCEYLRIVADYGIVGILLLIIWLFYLSFCYFRYPSEINKMALSCWISICIFGCFSYPLMYPFVWLILIYGAFLLICQDIKKVLSHISIGKLKIAVIFCFLLLAYFASKTYIRIQAEMEWACISRLSQSRKAEQILPKYEEVETVLGNDRYFLYSYSVELFYAKHYSKSLQVAMNCRKVWADYELEILLGSIFKELNDFENAEIHYQLASFMCPNRFIPLYELARLYERQGRNNEALFCARTILNKEIKISSFTIDAILKEMQGLIKRCE